MATYLRERDEAQSILAVTADRLNTALRESGCGEILGNPMHSLAIRDGIVDLYDRGAGWRVALATAQQTIRKLRSELRLVEKLRARAEKAERERDELRRMHSLVRDAALTLRDLPPDTVIGGNASDAFTRLADAYDDFQMWDALDG
jgi:hypothetical protein